jgi:hypothetical protein
MVVRPTCPDVEGAIEADHLDSNEVSEELASFTIVPVSVSATRAYRW